MPGPGVRPGQLQRLGNDVFATLERYYAGARTRPIQPVGPRPGDFARQLGARAPEQPRKFKEIMRDVEGKVIPGVTQWQHPGFMAYFPATTTVPAIMGDTLITGIGAVALQWSSSPIATEMEVVVMDWIAKAMGFTGNFLHTSHKGGGLIQSTASDAMAAVAVAARISTHRKNAAQLRAAGKTLPDDYEFYADSSKLVMYTSTDTNMAGLKCARIAGMRLRKIETQILEHTGNHGITPEQVEAAIKEDIKNGLQPCVAFLNYGTTNTTGYDDFRGADKKAGPTFKQLGEKYGVWIHVDAAYAGSCLILKERRGDTKDLEQCADSLNINGSKWLLCGFDTAFLWVKQKALLQETFSESGAYLNKVENVESIYSPEFRDWSIPLGRKFRALRVWLVLNYFGLQGIRKYIRGTISQTDVIRKCVEKSKYFETVVKTDLSLACLRPVHPETGRNMTHEFIDAFKSQEVASSYLFYPSVKDGVPFIRIALGGVHTEKKDVVLLCKTIVSVMRDLVDPPKGKGVQKKKRSSPGVSAAEKKKKAQKTQAKKKKNSK
eukprot:TRINITY_DN2540_c8_g1_i1.p1 TRINITY_DN2540_c8_g1~~TRINITY_DN2540_c8_g1_i1.p1  ORF type:complete len:549 (+),score=204.21 TRINITY_DN2540_c8_g1_i1:103-1749(+)